MDPKIIQAGEVLISRVPLNPKLHISEDAVVWVLLTNEREVVMKRTN